MARGLKGRGSRLGERTVSGRPSRGLSGRGGMDLPGPGESACGLIPGLPLSRPVGPEGPPVRSSLSYQSKEADLDVTPGELQGQREKSLRNPKASAF